MSAHPHRDGSGPALSNRRRRTRKDLLAAAARLLKLGGTPTMEAVAEEALVSRATAYRYFPRVEPLLVEAALDMAMPDAQAVFADDPSTDAEERIDRAEAALHAMTFDNEAQLRLMLLHALQHSLAEPAEARGKGPPIRQNRRLPLIQAALVPARPRLSKAEHERLCAALALIFGTEAMIVFRDVLGMDAARARQVKSWAARALVRAALAEAAPKAPRPVGPRGAKGGGTKPGGD